MSTVLGSSPKRHLQNKKAAAARQKIATRAFHKAIRKAKKSPRACRAAGRALADVAWAAGIGFAEMKGARRKKISVRKATGMAHAGLSRALKTYQKVCGPKRKKG